MAVRQAPRASYGGDTVLGRLLAQAGSGRSAAEVRALIAGVLAAPEPEDPLAWTALVAAEPGPALVAQLMALKAELAAGGGDGSPRAARLAELRRELERRDLAGFVLPRGDEHQGEYVAPRSERLVWLTGFTGSAGMAVVLRDRAAIFVDGRYTLQVRAQVDTAAFAPLHLIDNPVTEWLSENLKAGDRLGYDPWLHTLDGAERLAAACARAGATLVAQATNPIDAAWRDQPPPPIAPVFAHGVDFAGSASSEKRRGIGASLAKQGADAVVLTAPDSIAWLLNIRGGDVPHTPLPLSFAIVNADGQVDLFIDRRKLVPGLEAHLGNEVAVQPPDALGGAIDRLGEGGKRVLADPSGAAAWVFERLRASGARIVRGTDPCALPKACKNAVELANTRAAHVRDGAALTRFLAWLAAEGPKGAITELDAMAKLHAIRREGANFRDTSFTTIAGAGPNGAIVHYRATPETNRPIEPDMLVLIDSGAQYLDGTTDVTRTVAIGSPDAEQRERFTRVLQGHIAIATARFPEGTSGSQIDALARLPLWRAGLDFDHGTGHGVGSYLGVHEGPQRVSKMPNTVALRPGMIVSNEPGYYKTDAYGIRIENLVAVEKVAPPPGAERPLLGFETLTLAPIDRALVEPALLTRDETAWLDAYHARVRETLSPLVDAATAQWLAAATRPVVGS